MAHDVYYVPLKIYLNLSEPDLGHPNLPGMWEHLYRRKPWVPDLLCSRCSPDPDCPEWMYFRVQNGVRSAVHKSGRANHRSEPESPAHKAFKERIANAATRSGFDAVIEDRSASGKRRTDVLVSGSESVGFEVQLSRITADTVTRRSNIARGDGITPLWTCTDSASKVIDRAPWARTNDMPWQAIRSGTELLVRGGITRLELELCDSRRVTACPDARGRRLRCGNWHGLWRPAPRDLDVLVTEAASSALVPLGIPPEKPRWWMWVTPADRARYLDSQAGRPRTAEPVLRQVTVRRPLAKACNYNQPAPVRPAKPLTRAVPSMTLMTAPGAPSVTTKPLVLRMTVPGSARLRVVVGATCARCQEPNANRYGPTGPPWCTSCQGASA